MSNREDEVRAAYEAYIATRERIMAGELPWSALSAHFTEDAVFIDPAWGRVEGLDAMITFFDDSMQGLDGWEFPEEWTIVDGDRVVSAWWNRLPGRTPDGGYPQAPVRRGRQVLLRARLVEHGRGHGSGQSIDLEPKRPNARPACGTESGYQRS